MDKNKLTSAYCRICGKKLKIIESKYYNRTTGKKEFYHDDCDVQDCKHGHHSHFKWSWRHFSYICIYCGCEVTKQGNKVIYYFEY